MGTRLQRGSEVELYGYVITLVDIDRLIDAARFYVCDDFQILMILLQITTIYIYKQSYTHFSSYHKPLAFAQHPWSLRRQVLFHASCPHVTNV